MVDREIKECKNHGMTEFAFRKDGQRKRWRCLKCIRDQVQKRRVNRKVLLLEERGFTCMDCGYTGPPFVFDFDHRDPKEKTFGIASRGSGGIGKLREEANKCDLVCSNCHRIRTHKQTCLGCVYCASASIKAAV